MPLLARGRSVISTTRSERAQSNADYAIAVSR
jgi:hypothetical protein